MNEQEKQHNAAIIQEIYELRGLITECRKDAKKLAEHVNRGVAGREVALAITKLQEADMWLHQAVIECMPKPQTEGQSNHE
jgi:hypothetical protein